MFHMVVLILFCISHVNSFCMVSSVHMSTKHVNDIKNYYISGGQRYSERGYSEYRDLLSVAFQRNPTAFWVFIKHYVAKICTVSAKNNGGAF